MIINNVLGIENNDIIGQYEDNVYMMKFNEIRLKRGD